MPEPNASRNHSGLRREQRRLPPKRGIIKKRIIASIAKLFKRNRREEGAEDGDGSENCNLQNGSAQTHM
ncbi:PPR_long domain-containing protein [Psidium guajava]|nr:PPR_long domain-containing protein [Psidium guajava]